ncbi:hypothetical protein DES40_1756 [Litorimonas taeanensis]|uniref:Uncharacterized protein n=1 Tax=Litorimonas taeanensis TaxID=568099 RepID=A0A420WDJ2_9PROT|nr:hypothetical protein [Litorimonas taeanensis]RKQ68980.1 hypothetical protein DES40_1756 [Litorimonas taeanensis]
MVDFTNFENWLTDTKRLRDHLSIRLRMFLSNRTETKPETVVPGVLLTAYNFHRSHCSARGVTVEADIIRSWESHCNLIPKVAAEATKHQKGPNHGS